MKPTTNSILQAVVAILVLDTLGSLAVRQLGWSYVPVGLTAYVLYLVGGGVAGFRLGLGSAVLVGASMAIVHSAIGWPLAAWLGPDSVGEAYRNADAIGRLVSTGFSAVIGGVLGAGGGAVGAVLARHRSKA